MSTTERVSVSLPADSWHFLRTETFLAALDRGHGGEMGMARDLLRVSREFASAAESDILDAAELEVRESLGVELVA